MSSSFGRLFVQINQAIADRQHRRLRAVGDIEFLEDRAHVVAHRALGKVESVGDIDVGQTARQQELIANSLPDTLASERIIRAISGESQPLSTPEDAFGFWDRLFHRRARGVRRV